MIFLSVASVGSPATAQSARQNDKPRPAVQVPSAPLFLGVRVGDGDRDNGVLVERVFRNSPAGDAGVRDGDRILRIAGTSVHDLASLKRELNTHTAGDTVVVAVRRGREVVDVPVTLKAIDAPRELILRDIIGEPFPTFDVMEPVSGTFQKTNAWKGKTTLVEVWATWCGACRRSHGTLAALQKKHPNDLRVVALSSQNRETILKWLERHEKAPEFNLAIGDRVQLEALNVSVLPTFFVIDRSGKVREVAAGLNGLLRARAVTERLLKDSRKTPE